MLRKDPKRVPLGRRFLGIAIIGEAALFGCSYFLWNSLNQSRERREKAKQKYPWVLDKFYQLEEFMNKDNKGHSMRKADTEAWESR